MSWGYDIDQFVDPPDYDLICSICQGVLRCPVRIACHHIFCKKCILQWLRRQETCPCCRKAVNQSLIFVMYKLSKSIGRLRIKCRNESSGCSATFPLTEQYCHSTVCPFESVPCPHQGCSAQVVRAELEAHAQRCEHWRQPCPMGCGTVLSQQSRAQHNCYRQLRQVVETQREAQHAIVTGLQSRVRKVESAVARMKRQISLLCESLEIADSQESAAEHGVENSGSSS